MTNPPDTSVTERVARAIGWSRCAGACSNEELARAAISSMPALEEENARLRAELEVVRDWIRYDLPAGTVDATLRLKFVNAALSPRKEDQQ